MNEKRFEELDRKRFTEGLSEEEANELGQLLAEKMDKPYSNAHDRPHPESLPGEERSVDKKLDRRNLPPDEMPDAEVRERAEEQVGDQWDDREEGPLPKKIA
jgi:hypothetical protein